MNDDLPEVFEKLWMQGPPPDLESFVVAAGHRERFEVGVEKAERVLAVALREQAHQLAVFRRGEPEALDGLELTRCSLTREVDVGLHRHRRRRDREYVRGLVRRDLHHVAAGKTDAGHHRRESMHGGSHLCSLR